MKKKCTLYMGKYRLFCFLLYHQSWGLTYTRALKNIVVFCLENGGRFIHKSTYTRVKTVEVLVVVLEKFQSISQMYVQKLEQKKAIEHLLKGRNIFAV